MEKETLMSNKKVKQRCWGIRSSGDWVELGEAFLTNQELYILMDTITDSYRDGKDGVVYFSPTIINIQHWLAIKFLPGIKSPENT